MFVWSERNKVINVLTYAEQIDAAHTTDIVDMAKYKKCTFLIITGAAALNIPLVTVNAGIDNETCATKIIFNYRTQADVAPQAVGSDVQSALTKVTVAATGFNLLTNIAGSLYIVEVDAQVVAAGLANADHVSLTLTPDGTTHAVHDYSVVAILSEPRYPEDVLETAIG
ncbi:hypothetical protein ES705_33635 [subsurface metagenome]